MLILILGVALWWGAHLFKRLAPARRAAMGDRGKGLVAAALILSVLLMVAGYRMADIGTVWWGPSAAMNGINNLLVLIAIFLFASSGMKNRIGTQMRHPQLTGFALWALAHLLPNGDLPSFVLFGGLLLWALVEMAVINRSQPGWTPPPHRTVIRKEVSAAIASVVVFLVVGVIHGWVGPSVFGG